MFFVSRSCVVRMRSQLVAALLLVTHIIAAAFAFSLVLGERVCVCVAL